MLEWIIIGGGIQGCTVAAQLVKNGKAAIQDIKIIDPGDEPLAQWKRNTTRTGMEYLRSPSVHHLDVSPYSLQKYAKNLPKDSFFGFYKRPNLKMFNDHCEEIFKEINLQESWVKGRVQEVASNEGGFLVHMDQGGVLATKRIVIAIGVGEQPYIPDVFAEVTENCPERAYHIFSEEVPDRSELTGPIAVIGGGITAGHTAHTLSKQYPGQVHLLTRHELRIHGYDSDPGWLGPKFLTRYNRIKDYKERRNQIIQARKRGSMPKDVYLKLKAVEARGHLDIQYDEVASIKDEKGVFHCKMTSGATFQVSTIILATGFKPTLPEQRWLQDLIEQKNLSCANCGYPIVSKGLEWCPHLYVAGALAELELGPVARNIAGARKTAERIAGGVAELE